MRNGLIAFLLVAGCNSGKVAELQQEVARLQTENGGLIADKVKLTDALKSAQRPMERPASPGIAPSGFAATIKGQLDRIDAEAKARGQAAHDANVFPEEKGIVAGAGTPNILVFDTDVLSLANAATSAEARAATYAQVKKAPERFAGLPIVARGHIGDISESNGVTVAQLYAGYFEVGGGEMTKAYVVTLRSATEFVTGSNVEVVGYLANKGMWSEGSEVPAIAAIAMVKSGTVDRLRKVYRK